MMRLPRRARFEPAERAVYRSLTAPLLAAGGIVASALVAGPTPLSQAEPRALLGGIALVSALAALAAGTLVRSYPRSTVAAIVLATSATVFVLVSSVVDLRSSGDFGVPLGGWFASLAALVSIVASLPFAAAGFGWRRRSGR